MRLRQRAQSTIETAATFIVLVLLFGGLVNVWVWGNKQIVERQRRFNETRVKAGTTDTDYKLVWPVHRAEELKEEKVVIKP